MENLGLNNVIAAFNNCGLTINDEDARLIIKRYDDDRDGLLNFNNTTPTKRIFFLSDGILSRRSLDREVGNGKSTH